ncbi:lactate utilization protein [Candidatus Soleaferrea massiliensis]|uniref:lactate utilization protein n=1 Tax=Candidatus Soleaferrea massiliensis TaxID=1470354 RepID=UPI00058F1EF8|nr:lactate utilization protein [Candidatus Soleaferrea massiliensis]
MSNTNESMAKRIKKTMENLQKNNIYACYIPTKEDVVTQVAEFLNEGDTVSVGGSESLFVCGVIDYLREGGYHFLDRYQDGLTREEIEQIYRDAFSADAYLCSSNAVTENGELYNVDGNSNRTAAILYGPKSVIMVVGVNKLVKDLAEAAERVKTTAAPLNTQRLDCDTYCRAQGRCIALTRGESEITAGCSSDQRICCNYVISAKQRHKNRIKVILVGEPLGY